MPFSNELTDAQAERLAILLEELGEAQQVIGKILRHGYASRNPHKPENGTNRQMLEREIGDILHAIDRLSDRGDINDAAITERRIIKAGLITPYLHHQEEPVYDPHWPLK